MLGEVVWYLKEKEGNSHEDEKKCLVDKCFPSPAETL